MGRSDLIATCQMSLLWLSHNRQNDPDADEIWGGPNGNYSLTEARNNFKEHLIMYRDEKNTDKKLEIKRALIHTFTALDKYEVDSLEYEECWSKIQSYEKVLAI